MNLYAPSKVIIMQSLKALALTVSEKKAMVKFFSNKEICQISPWNMCKNKKIWYIHDLIDIINNRTKFKHNRIRTYNCQLKLFDTVMILKHTITVTDSGING